MTAPQFIKNENGSFWGLRTTDDNPKDTEWGDTSFASVGTVETEVINKFMGLIDKRTVRLVLHTHSGKRVVTKEVFPIWSGPDYLDAKRQCDVYRHSMRRYIP